MHFGMDLHRQPVEDGARLSRSPERADNRRIPNELDDAVIRVKEGHDDTIGELLSPPAGAGDDPEIPQGAAGARIFWKNLLQGPGRKPDSEPLDEPGVGRAAIGEPFAGAGRFGESLPVELVDSGEQPPVEFVSFLHPPPRENRRPGRATCAAPAARTILSHSVAIPEAERRVARGNIFLQRRIVDVSGAESGDIESSVPKRQAAMTGAP